MGNGVFSPIKLIIVLTVIMFILLGIGFMLLMPLKLKTPVKNIGCKVSGCNGEICQSESEEKVASICIYDPKYDCYKNAVCEKQDDNKCAWTQTEKLRSCLEEKSDNTNKLY